MILIWKYIKSQRQMKKVILPTKRNVMVMELSNWESCGEMIPAKAKITRNIEETSPT